MRISYPASSPYAATPQTADYIGRYVHRTVEPSDQDRYHTIKPGHNFRPDLLSHELYGTPAYWWVFCSRNLNVIRDPIWDFRTGIEIIVPSLTHLKATLG